MSASAPPASYIPGAGPSIRSVAAGHAAPPRPQPETGGRQEWLTRASRHNEEARAAAERGDVSGAARFILQALDCERRAGGMGPQVLQLIKPRA
jgi:hypothetical protein